MLKTPAQGERLPCTRAVDDDVVGEVVRSIRNLTRSATLEFTLRVGELVFRRIYGGDLRVLLRRKSKHASFRRLAAHPDLPFSAATLWRAVAIFELVRRLPAEVTVGHLGVAHLRSVLGLPAEVQARLLGEAESGRWSKAEIESRAAGCRELTSRRGRPRTPPALKVVDQVERLALCLAGSLQPGAPLALDAEDAARARRAVERLRALCDTVEEALIS